MEIINYSKKRFLVVEDQRPFLMMLRGLLNTLGAQSVAVAQNAESALGLCRKEKFDFVVTDIHLGQDKKNGYELIEELRARKWLKPTSVMLVISSDSTRHRVLGTIEKEPDDYLIKPFSQVQLKTRLNRAFHKRMELAPVYKLVEKDEINEAVDCCQTLLKGKLNYRNNCLKLLANLYLRAENYDAAVSLSSSVNENRPVKWAQVALARGYIGQGNPSPVFDIANQLLSVNRFYVESYDLRAQAHMLEGSHEEALEDIKQAIAIAPLSIQRQLLAAQIGRVNTDLEFAKECCHTIWQISKRSMHKDVMHFSNYVRSLLDIAEQADEKKVQNRYQQEALLTLQRSKRDEVFSRPDEQFDYALFETIVNSRISAIDGKILQAKQLMEEAQINIEQNFPDFPLKLAPDSIKVMTDIGDFEEAEKLTKLLTSNEEFIDPNVQYLLDKQADSQERKDAYKVHNKNGIDAYREGRYETAADSFRSAQELAPVNVGVALNLLQSLVKLLDMQRKPDAKLVKELKDVYKLVNSIPLRDMHQQKLDALTSELTPYIKSE
ncbi:response regulator [Alteromonas facilis]|uniref:response regulator n=1 Tax=Alteromonas facilis TaxID=2048004 RepID=UPI0013DBFE63|nr:response regulator [Alteromonas facilis]